MMHYKNKRGNEVVNKVMSINTGKKQNEQLQKKMAFNGSITLIIPELKLYRCATLCGGEILNLT